MARRWRSWRTAMCSPHPAKTAEPRSASLRLRPMNRTWRGRRTTTGWPMFRTATASSICSLRLQNRRRDATDQGQASRLRPRLVARWETAGIPPRRAATAWCLTSRHGHGASVATAYFPMPPLRSDRLFAWSPDNRYIAFAAPDSRYFTNVQAVSLDGAKPNKISFLANSSRRASPGAPMASTCCSIPRSEPSPPRSRAST